jgi:hypothetical protein
MNLAKFRQASLKRRTLAVPVPSMSDFFDDGQKPEIIVHGLTGDEVAQARLRVKQNAAIGEILSKIAGEKASEKIEGIQQALGLSDEVPDDTVYRIAVLEFGVDSIELNQEDCVKINAAFPEAFYSLTSKIIELTGLGQVPLGE